MTALTFPSSPLRVAVRTPRLSTAQLGLTITIATPPSAPPVLPSSDEGDDLQLVMLSETVQQLLDDGYAGVILTGPPGTSKSWYATRIGLGLVEEETERFRSLQFHSSYQYEDFVEGFVPTPSGFVLTPKHLLEMCKVAESYKPKLCVILIDELSRSDPGRIFGEALTYIEKSRRNQKFRLASGNEVSIPDNLVFLATMNPFDRSVDEVDTAFERRFAKVQMEPNSATLEKMLTDNGLDAAKSGLKVRILDLFVKLNEDPDQFIRIGHAYFKNVKDTETLGRLWKHQLRPHYEKMLILDKERLRYIEELFDELFTFASSASPVTISAPEEATETSASMNTLTDSDTP